MTSEPKTLKRKHSDSDVGSDTSSKRRAAPAPVEELRIKRHSENARLPTRGSLRAAGYDLYSAEKKIIPARGKALIDTQISVAVPEGTYGRVAPRSGLASKFGIDTGAGVIDEDYRGIVYILLFNLGERDFEVSVGDRIAQLVLERIVTPAISEVTELEDTARGNCGLGSTGGHGLLTPVSLSPVSSPPDLTSASSDSPPSDPTSPVPILSALPPSVLPPPVPTPLNTTSIISTSPDSTSSDSSSSDSTSSDLTTPASTPPDPASPVSVSLVVPPVVSPPSPKRC